MYPRKRLAKVIDQIIEQEVEVETEVDSSTVEEYKKLNDKCDTVIGKIKNRKGKKAKQIGE